MPFHLPIWDSPGIGQIGCIAVIAERLARGTGRLQARRLAAGLRSRREGTGMTQEPATRAACHASGRNYMRFSSPSRFLFQTMMVYTQ